jgi:acyl carrier protein
VSQDERAQALLEFIRRNFTTESTPEITLDTALLGENIVDSMGVTLLAAFIEERFDVGFDGTELRRDRMETVRDLVGWLNRHS